MTEHTIKTAHITAIDMSLWVLLRNQLRYLQSNGYQITGVSANGPQVFLIKKEGIHHISVPMTRRFTPVEDLISLWRLYWVMRRERFAIVHGHTPKAELLGQLAARLAGVPIVVDTFRGIYFRKEMHPLWRQLFIAMARIAASCADVVLSQSQEAMEMAIWEGICPPEKIKFLGNGIDVQRFARDRVNPTQLSQLRQDLGLRPNAPVVGFVGRLVREKGILELLQAAQIIRKQLPDVQFLLVGPIDHEKADALTSDAAQKYGLSEACVFTGMRDDMPEMYALMDVFVLPSHRESFPRSPMEAASMNVPCVVTDIPGCRETVEHGHNGLLVPMEDAGELASAIITLLVDKERARQMGMVGREIAEERFDERLVFARVKAEYEILLQEKGLPLPEPVSVMG